MNTPKVIITIAPTGGMASKKQNPHLPTQPGEIARDVIDCWNAGASVAAIHARRPDDQATCNPDIYRDINTRIRAHSDIVINNSTGGGVDGDLLRQLPGDGWEIAWDERVKGIEAGAEMCTLDATTVNLSFEGREILFNSPPSKNRELAAAMKVRGIKPEWEVFSPTHILQDVSTLLSEGLDDGPPFVNLVLNAHRGFQGAMPYAPKTLQFMADLLPRGAILGVSGIGAAQLPAAIQSVLLGGHVRTGLEDNLYYAAGELATNQRLIERLVRIVRDLGGEPATPMEAREILGLSRRAGPMPAFGIREP
ncbi:3-keto-5-aminohexanoate cleavage protein [Variovorax sp. dw_308]|uniref:3-keto-5-aminohexanoate cleavage protein n=1 Tax=Variovorax sp. dw_308 TaxID=2721546 RepID=UPI001C46CC87|nr:3-keto-5-aminohexanoate cleavage protein [Variovorax sp. dw_308]